AYVAEMPVNWCPELGTVLANEEVVDGKSEVGGFPVERRPMRQWMLRITAFAERLLDGLDNLDWPESIKLLQKNWIGRSEGAFVDFALEGDRGKFTVYTTRPDTLFGATYMVLAPEHPLVAQITTPEQKKAVDDYIKAVASKSERDRQDASKEKTGVFTGAYAINPVNDARVPVWIADYVLTGYGTGAIMAVPAHDDRDHAFAKKFSLPIIEVVRPAQQKSGIGFQPMNPQENVTIRSGANLPHWTQDGATYAVTFRLADSLPAQVLQQWQEDRNHLLERSNAGNLSPKEKTEIQKLFTEKIDAALDAGHGKCLLARPEIAQLVQDALHHFDGQRYDLLAWCIMPNHVHVIFRPIAGSELSGILHSWKSYTATEANRRLQLTGPFWQAESFDHLVRDREDFENQVRYVLRNPEKASLRDWKWCGSADHRQDADATDKSGIGFQPMSPFTGDGVAINSGILDGLPTPEAKNKITAWLAERGLGRAAVQYKLRDWLFSRQRYWGEPFPIVWENGKHRALEQSELPVRLPELADFKPTGTAEPPLSKAVDWVKYSPTATRELNTMPQWAGSCWYYLRYCDPRNSKRFVGEEAARYWLGDGKPKPGGVDLYVGGTEHAVLH
ncbi:MAG: transposase, partial [Chthoniobacterales bacterium]